MEAEFVPGLELAREFYAMVVRPLLAEHFPGVPYAAVTAPLDIRTRGFYYERPYQVIDATRFTAALREAITDPADQEPAADRRDRPVHR